MVVPNELAAVSDPNDRTLRSDSVDPTGMVYPVWCVALFEYQVNCLCSGKYMHRCTKDMAVMANALHTT